MKKGIVLTLVLVTLASFAIKILNDNPVDIFLKSLNEEQLQTAQLPFEDESKEFFHFFPSTMVDRAGISLDKLNTSQKKLAFKLLEDHLSEAGYKKSLKIIDLERVLAKIEGNTEFRNPEKYYIAIYGNPDKDDFWAWSFEGHHLSLNFTIYKDVISVAPRFMGANPATIKSGKRKGERTLANEEDLGIQLINDLSTEQQQKAIFQTSSLNEIVTFNTSQITPLKPVGIKMKGLNKGQQKLLINLIYEYLSSMPVDLANKRLENLKLEEINDIQFGWAGSTSIEKPHYYRIQGKSFLIEFDNIQNSANHIHSVWRDFDGDFGRDLIKEHYHKSPH